MAAPTKGPTVGPPMTATEYKTTASPRLLSSYMSARLPATFEIGAEAISPAKNRHNRTVWMFSAVATAIKKMAKTK